MKLNSGRVLDYKVKTHKLVITPPTPPLPKTMGKEMPSHPSCSDDATFFFALSTLPGSLCRMIGRSLRKAHDLIAWLISKTLCRNSQFIALLPFVSGWDLLMGRDEFPLQQCKPL